MSIIRSEKSKDYTVICNKMLRRDDISAKAKGLYAYIMTLPDDWAVYASELVTHFTDGKDSIASAFKELEAAGYIHKEKKKGENGRYDGWDYTVYETPITEKPKSEKPLSEKPKSENPPLLNTNLKPNTNNTNILVDIQFEEVWKMYGKYGVKAKAKEYWRKLTDDDRSAIKATIPIYLRVVASGRYKKQFEGWINPTNRLWENDWGEALRQAVGSPRRVPVASGGVDLTKLYQ